MDEPKPIPAKPTPNGTPSEQTAQQPVHADAPAEVARGSGHITAVSPRERSEHSVMEGLPDWKAERVASMRRELADLQRQLIEAQQRIATELQGRADDADRFEALEARLQAQEVETKRAAELELELESLRSQLANATANAEELRRDLAARDAQIEEARRTATEQVEAQASSLREAKALLESRDSERAAEQATRARLETELEDQRKQHREVSEQLEVQSASLRDANALVATRGTELAAMTAERDAAKAELDAARAKARDIATELTRFGQELVDGAVAPPSSEAKPLTTSVARRSQPPPVPARISKPQQVETILELSEDPKPTTSRMRAVLLMIAGVIVGCAATYALTRNSDSREDVGAPAGAAPAVAPPVAGASDPVTPVEPAASPSTTMTEPTPAPAAVSSETKDETVAPPPAPAPVATEGVILLPESANGRRVYVDGKVVKVKGARAVVPCGTHKVRIGSSGTEHSFDIACGAETTIADESRER